MVSATVNGPIVVLGAGPGLSIAARFGGERSPVALISRSNARHDEYLATLRSQGIEAIARAADIRDPEQLRSAVTHVEERLGGIATLYFGPGAADPTTRPAAILATRTVDLDDAVASFVRPAVDAAQLVLPGMIKRKRGVLLFATGLSAVVPLPQLGAMTMAAAALRTYALTLNAALHDSGVFAGALVIGGLIEGGDIHRHAARSVSAEQAGALPVLNPERIADDAWQLTCRRTRPELVFDALRLYTPTAR